MKSDGLIEDSSSLLQYDSFQNFIFKTSLGKMKVSQIKWCMNAPYHRGISRFLKPRNVQPRSIRWILLQEGDLALSTLPLVFHFNDLKFGDVWAKNCKIIKPLWTMGLIWTKRWKVLDSVDGVLLPLWIHHGGSGMIFQCWFYSWLHLFRSAQVLFFSECKGWYVLSVSLLPKVLKKGIRR